MSRYDRRDFIGTMILGAAGAAAITPPGAEAATRRPSLRGPTRRAEPDERYWEVVRTHFPLAPGLVLMNAANLCPSPYAVQDTVFELTRDVDRDASFQNRAKLSGLREAARRAVAAHLGADADEIALVRNTSEGNNTVVSGVELGAGDEVVVWDQNHPTNQVSWEVRARRHGFTVRKVATPPEPRSPEELFDALVGALGPRTRVLAFSHVSNSSGVALPAKALCAEARRRGVFTLVDGAQSCGALRVDLHDMGCDAYTASAHKWLTGPKEVGILYVKAERVPELWAADVGVGWQSAVEGGARKFESLGQRDDAAVAAVGVAVDFHRTIGPSVVEGRIRQLAAAIQERISQRLPGTRFHTPRGEALSAGVVVFAPPGLEPRPTYQRLYEEHGVGCASTGGATAGIRLSPHIYNTLAEVEGVVEALAAMAG